MEHDQSSMRDSLVTRDQVPTQEVVAEYIEISVGGFLGDFIAVFSNDGVHPVPITEHRFPFASDSFPLSFQFSSRILAPFDVGARFEVK